MVINAKSSNVDAHGRILLHCLNNWKIVSQLCSYFTITYLKLIIYICHSGFKMFDFQGWSNLSIVLEEMIAAFQRETPLFATYPVQNPTPHSQAKHLPAELVVQPNSVSSYGRSVLVLSFSLVILIKSVWPQSLNLSPFY